MSFSIPQLFLDNKPACCSCKRRLHFLLYFALASCMNGVTQKVCLQLLYSFAGQIIEEHSWYEVVVHKNVFRDCVKHLVVQNPIILHDNSRSHTAAAVTDLLRRWQWEILEHPPHSLDVSPCDCDLFAKVKRSRLKFRTNGNIERRRALLWTGRISNCCLSTHTDPFAFPKELPRL